MPEAGTRASLCKQDIGTDGDTRRFRQRWAWGVRKPGVPEEPHVSCPAPWAEAVAP